MEPDHIELVGYRCTQCGEDVVGEDGWWTCACYKIGMHELDCDVHEVPDVWKQSEIVHELKVEEMAIRTNEVDPGTDLPGLADMMTRDAQKAMDKLLLANLIGKAPVPPPAQKGLARTPKRVRKLTNREKRRERERVKKARR